MKKNLTNSRELFESLNTGTKYNKWVESFTKNKNFIKNIDYSVKPVTLNTHYAHNRIEYLLTDKVVKFLGMIEVIYGNVPSKANSYRRGANKNLISDNKVKQYERDFMRQCVKYRNKMIGCKEVGKRVKRIEQFPIGFEVDVYYSDNRHDLDNAFKIILDCLQKARAIKNDNKVTEIIAHKYLDKDNPRIEFKIYEIK